MPRAKKAPQTFRKDPKKGPVNAGSPHFELIHSDPKKKYTWVSKTSEEVGVDYYRDVLGYEPVQFSLKGARPRICKKLNEGDYIESRGLVLMAVDRARALEIDELGIDGNSGQQMADQVEKRMRNSAKSIAEISRNIAFRSREGAQYFQLEAERGTVAVADNGDE